MKLSKISPYLIPLMVIVCSAVLLAALTVAIGGLRWHRSDLMLRVDFADSTGIKIHSPVMYAGARAGSVSTIRYLTREERSQEDDTANVVRISIDLQEGVPVPVQGTTARIASESLLGEKFIALVAGPPSPE